MEEDDFGSSNAKMDVESRFAQGDFDGLEVFLKHDDPKIRCLALEKMFALDKDRAREYAEQLKNDEDRKVRKTATQILVKGTTDYVEKTGVFVNPDFAAYLEKHKKQEGSKQPRKQTPDVSLKEMGTIGGSKEPLFEMLEVSIPPKEEETPEKKEENDKGTGAIPQYVKDDLGGPKQEQLEIDALVDEHVKKMELPKVPDFIFNMGDQIGQVEEETKKAIVNVSIIAKKICEGRTKLGDEGIKKFLAVLGRSDAQWAEVKMEVLDALPRLAKTKEICDLLVKTLDLVITREAKKGDDKDMNTIDKAIHILVEIKKTKREISGVPEDKKHFPRPAPQPAGKKSLTIRVKEPK